jgi:hypothetical protein
MMSACTVRKAVRKALFAEAGAHGPALGRPGLRDRGGMGGIGSVLRTLHDPVIEEPLPSDLAALLAALDEVERRRQS